MIFNRVLSVLILLSIKLAFINQAFAQTQADTMVVQTEKQHSIGSSAFLLGNLASEDPPHFFQLNYGYYFDQKNIIVVEAKTWTYYEPLGTYGSSDEKYPGKIRAYGVGVGYQHFYWKKMYSTIMITPFHQEFFDEDDKKIQNGFQLYLQLRLGYRFEFFDRRWFVEPSVAFNYWPINTNFPGSFKDVEKDAPSYFLFEPGMHFGFRF